MNIYIQLSRTFSHFKNYIRGLIWSSHSSSGFSSQQTTFEKIKNPFQKVTFLKKCIFKVCRSHPYFKIITVLEILFAHPSSKSLGAGPIVREGKKYLSMCTYLLFVITYQCWIVGIFKMPTWHLIFDQYNVFFLYCIL